MTEVTAAQQLEEFEAVIAQTKALGDEPSSFFMTMYEVCVNLVKEGSTKGLSEYQMRPVEFQRRTNKKYAEKHGIKLDELGNVLSNEETKEKEEEKEPELPSSVRYVRVRVEDDIVLFDPTSGLTWVPNTGGLNNNTNYILQLKTNTGMIESVTTARVAGVFDNIEFKKTGKKSNINLPLLFQPHSTSVYHPISDPMFYIEPQYAAFAEQIFREAENVPQKVLISGPQGTGKTTLIEQLSARHNRGFFRMSCGMIESPGEWFGFRDVQNGELVYVPSAFIEACETPNTDICLDEFNRLHTTLQNGLYNILDDNGEAWLDMVKRSVRVASGVVFWATANIGSAHTGTFQIDAAMEDRFSYHVKMGYLPEEDEIRVLMMKTGIGKSLATSFVRFARKIREQAADENSVIDKPLSIRQLIACCQLVVGEMKPAQAVEFTVLPKYSEDGGSASAYAEVKKVLQGYFASR